MRSCLQIRSPRSATSPTSHDSNIQYSIKSCTSRLIDWSGKCFVSMMSQLVTHRINTVPNLPLSKKVNLSNYVCPLVHNEWATKIFIKPLWLMFNDWLTLQWNTFKDGSGSVNSLLCIVCKCREKIFNSYPNGVNWLLNAVFFCTAYTFWFRDIPVAIGQRHIRPLLHMGAQLLLEGSSNYNWKLSDGT